MWPRREVEFGTRQQKEIKGKSDTAVNNIVCLSYFKITLKFILSVVIATSLYIIFKQQLPCNESNSRVYGLE